MNDKYRQLGAFSDLVSSPNKYRPHSPTFAPGPLSQQKILDVLRFSLNQDEPLNPIIERSWQQDGLVGEEISWSVGYGPRTKAWFLKPADAIEPLPALLALHDHGSFKFYGKEKIADDSHAPAPILHTFRKESYGGRAYANDLAKAGFAVLIPDVFMWGSRRFQLETIPDEIKEQAMTYEKWWFQKDWPQKDIVFYNASTSLTENSMEICCNILGTTLAGVVSYEDRVAANYLASREDVDPDRMGCIGLSGGGARAGLLGATCSAMKACVVVAMMTTYEGLLDSHLHSHTWLFFPHGWAHHGDWPDLVASRAPAKLLVQYNLDDELFSLEGMQNADKRIAKHFHDLGCPDNYSGMYYPGAHKFDLAMQKAAFSWLKASFN